MNLRHLKTIRIVLSILVMLLFIQLFIGIDAALLQPASEFFLRLQVLPSLLRFLALFFTISGLGFLVVFLLTFFVGRVYCSSICPLGTLQDVITRAANLFKKKKRRKFVYSSNRKRMLRYGVLALTLVLWLSGSLFLVNLLDPYSNFGKLSVTFLQPAYIWLNNLLSGALEARGSYAVSPLAGKVLPWEVVLVSGGILLTLVIMASLRGRLFCNTLCPVGAMLGLIAAKSRYQIAFREAACNACGRCERVCKAECINSKTREVDPSRCISCFNCFASCHNGGLTYLSFSDVRAQKNRSGRQEEMGGQEQNKRRFMLGLVSALLSIPLLKKAGLAQGNNQPGMVPTGTLHPVTPPGSVSHDHFTGNCTACYLCVSVCPTQVIVPSFFDYGLEGFMQPKLDFQRSFCNYDCVRCTEVCPTGAITRQTREDKQRIQIGVARFMVESCIVMVDRTDCGACSEHCPTKAVHMVPFNGLFLPEVTPDLCVGCGACEFACPTEPYKAIYVESNLLHQEADPPSEGEGPRESEMEEFPF
jgi:ferredoxin-type protein NapF